MSRKKKKYFKFHVGDWVIGEGGVGLVKLVKKMPDAWVCESRSGEKSLILDMVLNSCFMKWNLSMFGNFDVVSTDDYILYNRLIDVQLFDSLKSISSGFKFVYDKKESCFVSGETNIDVSLIHPAYMNEVRIMRDALIDSGEKEEGTILGCCDGGFKKRTNVEFKDFKKRMINDSRNYCTNPVDEEIVYDIKNDYRYDVVDGKLYVYPAYHNYNVGDWIVFNGDMLRYKVVGLGKCGYYEMESEYGDVVSKRVLLVDENSSFLNKKDFQLGDFLVSKDFGMIYNGGAHWFGVISFKRVGNKFIIMGGENFGIDVFPLMEGLASNEERNAMLDAIKAAGPKAIKAAALFCPQTNCLLEKKKKED